MVSDRRGTDSIETSFKKLKNSGYLVVAAGLINAGMMYKGNSDFTDAQHAINTRQQLTFEQQSQTNLHLESAVTELRAIVAGQDRRLTMLEGKR